MDFEQHIRSLLDLEAHEDSISEEEEEEDDGEFDDFIDNKTDEEPSRSRGKISRRQEADASTSARGDSAFDSMMNGILHRAAQKVRRAPSPSGQASDLVERFARYPTANGFPLWRVRCRLGIEEEAVFFLARAALHSDVDHESRYQFHSSFVSPAIRGWIFIEGVMDDKLVGLLNQAPGIIKFRLGIYKELVDYDDWVPALETQKTDNGAKPGDWIRIRRGTYKGDLGLVHEVEEWGAFVLLVPRFQLPIDQPTHEKRKRGSRALPEKRLFDPGWINQLHNPENLPHLRPKKTGDSTYKSCGICYDEYGLVTRKYTFHGLAPIAPTSVSTPDSATILSSRHPHVLARQHALQWAMFEGERVNVLTPVTEQGRPGVITHVISDRIEVDLSSGGVETFRWTDIEKIINPGDCVQVIGGPAKGKVGWVLGIEGSTAEIAEDGVRGAAQSITSSGFAPFKRHVNSLKIIGAPNELIAPNQLPQAPPLLPRSRLPWLGLEVAIVSLDGRSAHPWRGRVAIVEDVLYGQDTLSGLRLTVRLKTEKYDPSRPWSNRETVDYDFVVEKHTRYQLFDIQKPEDEVYVPMHRPHGHRCLPGLSYRPTDSTSLLVMHTLDSSPTAGLTSTGTPPGSPRDSSAHVEPAWDSSSRTALLVDSGDTQQCSDVYKRFSHIGDTPRPPTPPNLPTSTQANVSPNPNGNLSSDTTLQHILLDRRLVGIEVKVVYKSLDASQDIAVSTKEQDDAIIIQRMHYGKSVTFPPKTIQLKHPNPTRDTGPLVIIKGEHCGKRVRRIHHRYENGRPIARLAVVRQSGAELGELTGEEVELSQSDLCIATETKEQKKHLDRLLSTMREAARKIRAK